VTAYSQATHSQAMRNVSPPLSKHRPVTFRTILSALVAIGFAVTVVCTVGTGAV
jgi:hypothetical protein